MEYRPLGRTGLNVSAIGLGCVTFGREIDEASAVKVLARALELGVNVFDTAESYGGGRSERLLGRLLARRQVRDRVLVCSKVGGALDPARVLAAAQASLDRLELESLDLYLLHNYDPVHPLEETLEALDQLVAQRKVRFIGCSNFTGEQLSRALEIQRRRGWTRFSVIEPMYNLVARRFEVDLLPLCDREDLGVLAYSPLGAGFLTGKYDPNRSLPAGTRFALKPGHRRHYFYPRSFAMLKTLEETARASGVPAARLCLAWVLRQRGISSMLISARIPEQVDQAWEAWLQRDALAPVLSRLTESSRDFVNPPTERLIESERPVG